MLFRLDCGILGSRLHVLRASIPASERIPVKGRAELAPRDVAPQPVTSKRTCEAPSPCGAATEDMPPPGPPLQPPYAPFHRTQRSPYQDAVLSGLLERPRLTRRIPVG